MRQRDSSTAKLRWQFKEALIHVRVKSHTT